MKNNKINNFNKTKNAKQEMVKSNNKSSFLIGELRYEENKKERLLRNREDNKSTRISNSYLLSVLALLISIILALDKVNSYPANVLNALIFAVTGLVAIMIYSVIHNEYIDHKAKRIDKNIDEVNNQIIKLKNELYDKYNMLL